MTGDGGLTQRAADRELYAAAKAASGRACLCWLVHRVAVRLAQTANLNPYAGAPISTEVIEIELWTRTLKNSAGSPSSCSARTYSSGR